MRTGAQRAHPPAARGQHVEVDDRAGRHRRRHALGVDGHRHLEQPLVGPTDRGGAAPARRHRHRAELEASGSAASPPSSDRGRRRGNRTCRTTTSSTVTVSPAPMSRTAAHTDEVVGRRQHASAGHHGDGHDEDADPQPRVAPARTCRPDGQRVDGDARVPRFLLTAPSCPRPAERDRRPGVRVHRREEVEVGPTAAVGDDTHVEPSAPRRPASCADRRRRGAQHLERAGLRAGAAGRLEAIKIGWTGPVAGGGDELEAFIQRMYAQTDILIDEHPFEDADASPSTRRPTTAVGPADLEPSVPSVGSSSPPA